MSFRKNILIINPWITDFTAYDFWLKPLALLYLAAWVKTFPRLEVDFIDFMDRSHSSHKNIPGTTLSRSAPKVGSGDLAPALSRLEAAGYNRSDINVYLIAGLPGQTYREIKKSVLDVLRLGARPRLTLFSPVPGTADWRKLCREGWLNESSDPLLHNKIVFLYRGGGINQEDYDSLKLLSLGDDTVRRPG